MSGFRTRVAGFSLFELAVVLVVIGVLSTALLDRLSFYRQQAEDIMFRTTLVNMRTGLRLHAFQLANAGKVEQLKRLQGENPVQFLVRPPTNYLGEINTKDEKELPHGYWYFRKGDGYLVYLLNSGNSVAIDGQKSLNFKVKLLRVPKNSASPLSDAQEYHAILEQVEQDSHI